MNNIPRWAKCFVSMRDETFAVLFWGLGIVQAHILQQMTQPAGLVSLNHGTVRQGSVIGSTLIEDALAPLPFPI